MRLNPFRAGALALIPLLPLAAKAEGGPLTGKTFGVEANFARLLLIKDVLSFSGGISLFGLDRDAEIAFPFLYSRSEIDASGPEESLENIDFTEITQDIHYRYFPGHAQNGFYVSGFARFAYLEGVPLAFAFGDAQEQGAGKSRDSQTKFGLGVGLGYRIFSHRGLYWGAGLNLGRYVPGGKERFRGAYFDLDADQPNIIDMELLKIGWAF